LPMQEDSQDSAHTHLPEKTLDLQSMIAFIRSENEEHRKYFMTLYKWAAGALTLVFAAMVGAVTFFGFRTIDGARDSASKAAGAEVDKMRTEVRNRINSEFQSDAIKQTVRDAAKEQSKAAIVPIVKSEVSIQVRRGVEAEQGIIKTAMLNETHRAVDSLTHHIDRNISEQVTSQVALSVNNKVRSEVDPTIAQLKRNANLSLFIRAQSGEGRAFDSLNQLWHDGSVSQEDREMAERAVKTIYSAHDWNGIYVQHHFNPPKTDLVLVQLIQNSPNVHERKTSLDCLSIGASRENIDLIYRVMTTDVDLNVRDAAFRAFNQATSQTITILDNDSAMVWWKEHRKDFVK